MFIGKELRWKKTAFLSHSNNHFPSQSYSPHLSGTEEKKVTSMVVVSKETVGIGSVKDYAWYGSFNKLIQVTSFLLRFVNNLMTNITKFKQKEKIGEMLVEEKFENKIRLVR